ncbi:two-component sensor histidine kinase [Rhodococcoides trifolii]|uniref:histidine kinase n=1 Tax=Rhodococcoides trifolii TaxID=908250 RepID=A0A917FZQ5_9NOCA|nr:HAMP domain-containing sensor histidine kinase [Rhodococcus trifolii]GGG15590.1 two-component sensor histidine kinase [Rhodococcus trifolii]
MTESSTLHTASLRRRLILSAMSVMAIVLVVVVVATSVLLEAQLRSSATSGLAGRASTAQQMLDRGSEPAEIVAAATGPNIAAQLITTDGRVYGNLALRPAADAPKPPSPPSGGPGTPSGAPTPPDPAPPAEVTETQVSTSTLSDGSVLTVAVDASAISDIRRQLLLILVPVVLAAAALAALALSLAVSRGLRPLRAMTAVARSITTGNRGHRLKPDDARTELGETAAAFDEMLDALEGAEVRERDGAARTRRFFDDAAHDLRTPVAGVAAAAEALLRAGPEADADVRERLQLLMVREARHAARLIDDLLAAARIETTADLTTAPVDLVELVRADADRVRVLAPETAVTVVGDSVVANVDRVRMAQVLANLTDNARRHNPPGTDITVSVEGTDHGARIVVRDNGLGIAPEDRERVFDRMVRLDNARSSSDGSGLGLAIARTLVRQHGGEIVCVGNEPDVGSSFEITLPLSKITLPHQ